jgi:hypothetical protein
MVVAVLAAMPASSFAEEGPNARIKALCERAEELLKEPAPTWPECEFVESAHAYMSRNPRFDDCGSPSDSPDAKECRELSARFRSLVAKLMKEATWERS